MVKNPPANAGNMCLSPGSGDPLEKEMATHSSILAWKIPWTEGPGELQSMGSPRVDSTAQSEHKKLQTRQGWLST